MPKYEQFREEQVIMTTIKILLNIIKFTGLLVIQYKWDFFNFGRETPKIKLIFINCTLSERFQFPSLFFFLHFDPGEIF